MPEESSIVQTARKLTGHELSAENWLSAYFSTVCTAPNAQRHVDHWKWVENLKPGVRPKAKIDIWPRGGGKSTTGELTAARVCTCLTRRFMLIVAGTQDQANQRVGAIATHFERMGVKRAVNQFGNSKGWRLDLLRTDNGFNVLAYGLDAAARGVKLDEFRPDFIFLDDIDGLLDTPETTQKKIDVLTKTVLPTGSIDCAVLYVQNRILEFGVMSQLADGTAEFLLDREPISEEPAVYGLRVEREEQEGGNYLYRIREGVASWEGQPLNACEDFINTYSLSAFKQECQHEVSGAGGFVFNADMLGTIQSQDVPPLSRVCLAGDFAATEGGGDYTALGLLGVDSVGRYYLLAVVRGQWGSERVNEVTTKACEYYLIRYQNWTFRLPKDPAAAGDRAALADRKLFEKWRPKILPVTGKKKDRAKDGAEQVNLGNVYLVQQDLPDCFKGYVDDLGWRRWHMNFRQELKQFREDEKHERDDQVDMFSDAFNEIHLKKTVTSKKVRTGGYV